MANFPDILKHFPPAAVARHAEAHPDTVLRGDGDWPDLQGLVGVFFTSRSGSTALTRLAERHFQVRNVGETLNVGTLQTIARNRAHDSLQSALAWSIRSSSPGGWHLFKSGGAGLLNAARIGFLDRYGAMIRPILLLRQDIVGQALSLFVAQATRQFHSTQATQHDLTEADFDAGQIADHVAVIRRGNARLEKILAGFAYRPRFLLYEHFRDGDTAATLAALAATGLPARAQPLRNETRAVRRMTHPLTAQFRARFMDSLTPRTEEMIAGHAAMVADWLARDQPKTDST